MSVRHVKDPKTTQFDFGNIWQRDVMDMKNKESRDRDRASRQEVRRIFESIEDLKRALKQAMEQAREYSREQARKRGPDAPSGVDDAEDEELTI